MSYLKLEASNFILPPSRGGFIDIPLTAGKTLIGMYQDFISQLDILKAPTKEQFTIDNRLDKLLQEIFDGKIKTEKYKTLYSFHGTTIPITAAASSIKELAPIFLLLKKRLPKDIILLWEEPETHLHPTLQRKVAKLVSYMLNNGANITITTHSDYFFNQINTLIKLYHVKQKTDAKRFSKLLKTLKIDEQFIINPDMVGAYYFKRQNGKSAVVQKQTLDYAIPIESFTDEVNKMLNETDTINDILYE